MRRASLACVFLLTAVCCLRADDQVRAVQQQLKDQGFFYGDVDGDAGAETVAAVRRFQIRNGLDVTGTIDQETLNALKMPGAPAARPQARNQSQSPGQNPGQNQSQPQAPDVSNADREFLHQQTPSAPPAAPDKRYVGVAGPEASPVSLAGYFRTFYAQTPYASAPPEVQVETLRRAQSVLVRYGGYRAMVDGQPGPETQRALLVFQQNNRLVPTGRLDMDTLSVMRLLPGRGILTPRAHVEEPPQPYAPPYAQPLRGIWVH